MARRQPAVSINNPLEKMMFLFFPYFTPSKPLAEKKNTLTFELLPKRIPVATSAHHIHLSEEHCEILFGEGYELRAIKPLIQPGQFACAETVNLVGPKGRIEKVRVLGPLRKETQVEVSASESRTLGIQAQVRDSGEVKKSSGIKIEGPCGCVILKQGLICARRHIHMSLRDAKKFGVKDGDKVMVRVKTACRSIMYDDVIVRVNKKFILEMHIDTDEANAAGISIAGAIGRILKST